MTALRALFAIGFAAFWLVLVGAPMFVEAPRVETGVHLVLTGAIIQPNIVRVDPGSPAYRAGLRSGDALGCLSLESYSLLLSPSFGFDQAYRAGTPISTCVRRNGALTTISFTAQTGPLVRNTYGSSALAALRLCVLLVFLLTGIALVMARPSPMTWILYAYCIASAPSIAVTQVGTFFPAWAPLVAFVIFATSIGVAFLLVFSVLVPDERIPAGWRRPALYCAVLLAIIDMALNAVSTFTTGFTMNPVWMSADELLTGLTVLVIITRLATMQPGERARFGWAAFAIIFGVVMNDLRNVLAEGPYQSFSVICAYLTVVMPVSLMYAILKRHVIDVRFVISRTVVYAALTTLIVGVIGIVDWLTSAYLHQARMAMAIDAAVTIGLAFALHRAYRWIESAVDFVLFRAKHNAENYLNRMAKTLLRAKSEETIDRALVQAPYEMFDLTMAGLFTAQGNIFKLAVSAGWNRESEADLDQEHELVRFLATERTKLHIRDLRKHVAEEFQGTGSAPAIAIPLFQSDVLIAFAVYGIHRDGTKLDPDEIETLERLCDVAAQAYTGIELARYRSIGSGVPPMERLQYQ